MDITMICRCFRALRPGRADSSLPVGLPTGHNANHPTSPEGAKASLKHPFVLEVEFATLQ